MSNGAAIVLLTILCAAYPAFAQKVCDVTSIGLDPVTVSTSSWNGIRGGLYPEGSNLRPFEHEMRLRDLSAGVRPCAPNGEPDDINGKLVILGIGGVDAYPVFSALASFGRADTTTHRGIVFANACGPTIRASDLRTTTGAAWSNVLSAVQETGASGQQIAVAWVLLDDMQLADTAFPASANAVADVLADVCRSLKANLPSIRLVYFSSRTYSGYIDPTETTYPEAAFVPRDNIHGWAIKALIERQINGVPGYSFGDESSDMPALSWSAYLWSDGTTERVDGLSWKCEDFESDGLILTPEGALKAARLIHSSFNNDQVSRGWYTRKVVTSVHSGRNNEVRVWSEPGAIRIQNAYGPVDVRGLRGNIAWNGTASGDLRVDASGLSSGAYVVTVDGTSYTVILR